MPQNILAIGVHHTTKHPSYPEVLDFIEQTIHPEERIAVESPWNLDRIDKEGADHRSDNYCFLFELCTAIRKKHAHVFPVEDDDLYDLSGALRYWYMYEGSEALNADERWHELSIKRSIRHLQLAHQYDCGKLFTGISHAYELRMMGYEQVITIPENHEEEDSYKKNMKPHIERFGVDLATDEWQHKRYPLLSDMTLRPEE